MNILAILPELVLFIGALTILLIGVVYNKHSAKSGKNFGRLAFLLALAFSISALITVISDYNSSYVVFNNSLFVNKFTSFVKIIILSSLIMVLLVSEKFIESSEKINSEFVSLMLIATVGSMFLISSNDLLPFYMSLELQSLSLYILAASRRSSVKSSEASMKYFLLGSVASGILLLGISMVYGFSGTTNFSGLFYLINNAKISAGILLGLVLILTALLFKVSAAPFHMWTPDVYEGSPTSVTTFFASTIKFAAVLVLTRVYINLINIWPDINQILVLTAVLSLLTGSLSAIRQNNFKRLLAYSGISHVGFILAGLSAINVEAIKAAVIYMVIYSTLSLGSFAFLIMLSSKKKDKNTDATRDKIYDLSVIAGMSKKHPIIAACLAILMFSMAGIPPLGGFFAKFYVIVAIISKGYYYLAILAVLTSVISAFYYIRIVKIMYFDESKSSKADVVVTASTGLVLIIMALINLAALALIKPLSLIVTNILT